MVFEQITNLDGTITNLLDEYRRELRRFGLDTVGQCLRTSIGLAPKFENLFACYPSLSHLPVEIEIGNWGRSGCWVWLEGAMNNLTATKTLLSGNDYHAWIRVESTIIDLTILHTLAKTQEELRMARAVYYDVNSNTMFPNNLNFNYNAKLTIPWRSLVTALQP
ncbi:hypothetical protein H9643_01325 [Ochrobactrum sp. Sa2BUA5]|nr:hypothetical protein [Ochrobactrum gallinarum]